MSVLLKIRRFTDTELTDMHFACEIVYGNTNLARFLRLEVRSAYSKF